MNNTEVIQLHELTFSAPSRGLEHVEHVIGTYQQLNDYAISQASSMRCLWGSVTLDQGGFTPTFNTSEINEIKILANLD